MGVDSRTIFTSKNLGYGLEGLGLDLYLSHPNHPSLDTKVFQRPTNSCQIPTSNFRDEIFYFESRFPVNMLWNKTTVVLLLTSNVEMYGFKIKTMKILTSKIHP